MLANMNVLTAHTRSWNSEVLEKAGSCWCWIGVCGSVILTAKYIMPSPLSAGHYLLLHFQLDSYQWGSILDAGFINASSFHKRQARSFWSQVEHVDLHPMVVGSWIYSKRIQNKEKHFSLLMHKPETHERAWLLMHSSCCERCAI